MIHNYILRIYMRIQFFATRHSSFSTNEILSDKIFARERVWKGILTCLIISDHMSLVMIFVFGKVWKAEFLGREFSHAMMPWCHQSAISWPRVKCLHKMSIGQTIHGTARIVASLPNWTCYISKANGKTHLVIDILKPGAQTKWFNRVLANFWKVEIPTILNFWW